MDRTINVPGVIEALCALCVTAFARVVTGVRAEWRGCRPQAHRRVYFANHCSHGDFVLIWSVLPPAMRRMTRPVAGADYWERGAVRRFIGRRVFRAVLIDRTTTSRDVDPIAAMANVLDQGFSLIVFPEGTRNLTDERLLPFKSGLYRLAAARPGVEFVPVWIDNLNRVMPKGEMVPIPLLCTVSFGAPINVADNEAKSAFLDRARQALLDLAPDGGTCP
jgi:1-acyl-sn-glycerol-3-phosphate acyltransferase